MCIGFVNEGVEGFRAYGVERVCRVGIGLIGFIGIRL